MRRVELPNTGLTVPPVALGTWGLAGPLNLGGEPLGWPLINETEARAVVHAALDSGLNFIDTSDFYGSGRSEEIIGKALGPRRARTVLATKWGLVPRLDELGNIERKFSVANLSRSLDSSLRRLKTDYIDLYQLHGPPRSVLAQEDLWMTLESLKRMGKILSVGVSLRSSDARDPDSPWWQQPGIDVWQVPYSPIAQSEVSGIDLAVKQQRNPTFVLARSVLHHGLLVSPRRSAELSEDDHRRKKISDVLLERVERFWSIALPGASSTDQIRAALAFTLGSNSVSSAIIGATSTIHVKALAELLRDDRIFDAQWSHDLRAIAQEVF